MRIEARELTGLLYYRETLIALVKTKKPQSVIITTISTTLFTRAGNILASYLALLDRLNPSESEDNLPIDVVTGYIYLPILIFFYFNCHANRSKTPHNTVTFSLQRASFHALDL